MKIKNWGKFQHFKNRRPPWVKLYRDLLDDMEWHMLDAVSSKLLVSLWLLASEDPTTEGHLPDIKTISFRCRIPESQVKTALSKLGHWVDISEISERYQDGSPETETETETEKKNPSASSDAGCANGTCFDTFWKAYPRKKGKLAAQKAFAKIKSPTTMLPVILSAISNQVQSEDWLKEGGQFIPHPATWLNQGRWDDETEADTDAAMDANLQKTIEEARQNDPWLRGVRGG